MLFLTAMGSNLSSKAQVGDTPTALGTKNKQEADDTQDDQRRSEDRVSGSRCSHARRVKHSDDDDDDDDNSNRQ
ncbi:hypothetical protein ACOMHN_021617 [Nucella lapillus]